MDFRRRQTALISKHQCKTFGITWNLHHCMYSLMLSSSVAVAFLQFSCQNIYILKFGIVISDVSARQIT